MRTYSKTLMAAGLIAAFAALPLAQAAAQDTTSQSTTTQTTQSAMGDANQTVPGKANDAWITTKVKSEFATTKNIHATDISVDTMEGKVTLTGSVGSKHEKMKAVRVAKHVKGVKSVDASGLTVSAMTKTTTTSTTTEQPASSSTSGQ